MNVTSKVSKLSKALQFKIKFGHSSVSLLTSMFFIDLINCYLFLARFDDSKANDTYYIHVHCTIMSFFYNRYSSFLYVLLVYVIKVIPFPTYTSQLLSRMLVEVIWITFSNSSNLLRNHFKFCRIKFCIFCASYIAWF